MRIAIASRLRPFVHRPGVPMLVPGTGRVVTPFPTHIALSDGGSIVTGVSGPVTKFSACQDLEKGRIIGWGTGRKGYFRWELGVATDRHTLVLDNGKGADLFRPVCNERLSLGCHKQQDWDLCLRRLDLREIVPIWYRLGQLTPDQLPPDHPPESGDSMLDQLAEESVQGRRDLVAPLLVSLLRSGFEGVMVPHHTDSCHWGYAQEPVPPNASPLALLTQGAAYLRSLFVRYKDEQRIALLPLLPREFVSGRMTGVTCLHGEFDLEWSKRTLRRVIFRSAKEGEIGLALSRDIQRFRLRRGKQDRGVILDTKARFAISRGEVLWLDRFER